MYYVFAFRASVMDNSNIERRSCQYFAAVQGLTVCVCVCVCGYIYMCMALHCCRVALLRLCGKSTLYFVWCSY